MAAKILCVVGARPNFMKMASVLPALRDWPGGMEIGLVHTGQHYDEAMKDAFFRELEIPEPDMDLGVGSGTHAVQTAEIMRRFEPVLDRERPTAILVVGDVNSTIACALVAVKKGIGIIHVEAGLRSRDRAMPEEINRILTDQISDFLFTTERSAETNLMAEGIEKSRIHFVGNVMIDTLLRLLPRAPRAGVLLKRHMDVDLASSVSGFGLVTLHRPANVDDPGILKTLLDCLMAQAVRLPLLFPMHPRTRGRIQALGMEGVLEKRGVLPLPPLAYLEMLGLMKSARVVLTDSGGIQEETTALGRPCLTLRDNTERPITVSQGTNTLVGRDPDRITRALEEILETGGKSGRVPELWDGRAANRIARILWESL